MRLILQKLKKIYIFNIPHFLRSPPTLHYEPRVSTKRADRTWVIMSRSFLRTNRGLEWSLPKNKVGKRTIGWRKHPEANARTAWELSLCSKYNNSYPENVNLSLFVLLFGWVCTINHPRILYGWTVVRVLGVGSFLLDSSPRIHADSWGMTFDSIGAIFSFVHYSVRSWTTKETQDKRKWQ